LHRHPQCCRRIVVYSILTASCGVIIYLSTWNDVDSTNMAKLREYYRHIHSTK
jgi:hypothetical protein